MIAMLRQRPADGGGLAIVELAAQRGKRYFSMVVHGGRKNNESLRSCVKFIPKRKPQRVLNLL
jgi:hypothetical protein